jgi:arylsulfatase A-like enzyme
MYKYRVMQGEDPLGYTSDPNARALCDGEYHASHDWLAAPAALAHPDIVPQQGEAFDSPRSGDIIIFAAPGWAFSLDYVGGHGGIERDEMLMPMYFAGPGLPPGGKVHAARLVDLVPTVLDLMGWRDSVERPHRFDGASIAGGLHGQVH